MHPVGSRSAAPASMATRTTTSRTTSRSSTTPRRRTRITSRSRPTALDRTRLPACRRSGPTRSPTSTARRSSTRRTISTTPATSTSWWRRSTTASCRRPRSRRSASSRPRATRTAIAGYSDPADEQAFVTREINSLMRTPDWHSTVVIVNYDDSDGWYDHVYSGVTNPSLSPADNLTNTTRTRRTGLTDLRAVRTEPADEGAARRRAGPLRLRPADADARDLAVRHVRTTSTSDLSDQASIINFIEYNWHLPGIPGSADQVLAKLDRSRGPAVRPGGDVRLPAIRRPTG